MEHALRPRPSRPVAAARRSHRVTRDPRRATRARGPAHRRRWSMRSVRVSSLAAAARRSHCCSRENPARRSRPRTGVRRWGTACTAGTEGTMHETIRRRRRRSSSRSVRASSPVAAAPRRRPHLPQIPPRRSRLRPGAGSNCILVGLTVKILLLFLLLPGGTRTPITALVIFHTRGYNANCASAGEKRNAS